MEIIQFHDLAKFADRVRPMLMEHECENCWPLGIIGSTATSKEPPILLSIESHGQVIGAAIQAFPPAMGVTRLPQDAIKSLVEKLAGLNWSAQGFVGPIPTIDRIADLWCNRTGVDKQLHLGLRVFQLTLVTLPATVEGKMIPATPEHLDLLAQWRYEFCHFVGEPDPEFRQNVQRAIDEARAFVWDVGGQPRSMANIAGPTPNGIRINMVYTPVEFRRRGYALNLVASLSQRMLESGRTFCFLFTDLANPTSNKIYQQIGYHPVCDFRHWRLIKAHD